VIMKFLNFSGFHSNIEYSDEGNRRASSERRPQVHRMSGDEITEAKYYFVMKRLK